jgi:hypothetical protein
MDFKRGSTCRKKLTVLENTNLRILGLKRENVRTDGSKLQDAEI